MSLNEKLAIEVMGWENRWEKAEDGYTTGYPEYRIIRDWQPTTDLNQLRECYLAAEKDNPIVFWAMYWSELKKLFSSSLIEEDAHCATAWVKHPELVAQAILKAKGVEV